MRIFTPFLVSLFFLPFIIALILPFNSSYSMPYGWYLRTPPLFVKEGALVEVENPKIGYMGVRTKVLFKRIEKIDGDDITVKGEHKYSYDSRYFGSISRKDIKSNLFPVYTFHEIPAFLQKKNNTGL